MEDFHESFVHFWEALTGVLDDDGSKILRIMCFFTLFLGIIWAGLNYFRAERIANVNEELYTSAEVEHRRGKNETLERLMAAAQAVGTMRRGGEEIARKIGESNLKPFNLDGYDELGLEDLSGITEFAPDSEFAQEKEENRTKPEIKALFVSGRNRYAVIDYAAQKGAVIRQGQTLPGGEGRIVRITPEGITVRYGKDEITYTVK